MGWLKDALVETWGEGWPIFVMIAGFVLAGLIVFLFDRKKNK